MFDCEVVLKKDKKKLKKLKKKLVRKGMLLYICTRKTEAIP